MKRLAREIPQLGKIMRTEAFLPRASQALRSRNLLLALVLFGGLCRLVQYMANRSLWLNESALVLNILNRSPLELADTLDFNQGAPIGFLLIEKLSTLLINQSEYALRLFPLLCGLVSVVLFKNVAHQILTPLALPVALLLFASADGLIYYASEVKQYSSDVAAGLVLYLMAFALADRRSRLVRTLPLLLILGSAAIWVSHPAALVATGVAVVIAPRLLRTRTRPKHVWPVLALFAVSVAVVGFISYQQLGHLRATLTSGPTNVHAEFDRVHSLKVFATAISAAGGLPTAGASFWGHIVNLVALLALFGAVALFQRDRTKCLMILFPAIFTFFASALGEYPLFPRTLLFLLPNGILLVAEGIVSVAGRAPRWAGLAIGGVLVGTIAVFPVSSAVRHLATPRHHEEIKPVLRFVQENWKANDTLFLHYGSQYAFRYYSECGCADLWRSEADHSTLPPVAPAEGGPLEFAPAVQSRAPELFVGSYAGSEWRSYLAQLEPLRGRPRVWILYTHVNDHAEARFLQYDFLAYLNRIGRRLMSAEASQAHVYLYDLRGE